MTPAREPEDHHALAVTRVVEQRDLTRDWEVLERAAAVDPSVWADLAQSLREASALRRALADELARADAVALPAVSRLPHRRTWVAAAAAFAFAVGTFALGRVSVAPAPPPSTTPLGELPRLVVEARETADGRTEVVYLRRSLERAVVDRVVEIGSNEHGEPKPRLVDAASLRAPQRF